MSYSDCPGLDSYYDTLFQQWEDQAYAEDEEETNDDEEQECDDEE